MESLPPPQKRIRVNVSTSVKGVKTYDATLEVTSDLGLTWQSVVEEHKAMIAELDRIYPPTP